MNILFGSGCIQNKFGALYLDSKLCQIFVFKVVLTLVSVSVPTMGNNATALRPEIVEDLAESTDFTADEIREFYKKFLKETESGRMSLSQEEFSDAYKNVFPDGDASKFASHVFERYDKDGNGRIGEFCSEFP